MEVYESTFSLHQKICRGEKGTVWSNALALHRGAQVLSCGSEVLFLGYELLTHGKANSSLVVER